MNFWDWFQENEAILSGIAAALVISGALAAVGRDFLKRVFNLEDTAEFYNLVMSLWDKYQKELSIDLHVIKNSYIFVLMSLKIKVLIL